MYSIRKISHAPVVYSQTHENANPIDNQKLHWRCNFYPPWIIAWNLQIVLFEASFLGSAEPVTLRIGIINKHAVISLPFQMRPIFIIYFRNKLKCSWNAHTHTHTLYTYIHVCVCVCVCVCGWLCMHACVNLKYFANEKLKPFLGEASHVQSGLSDKWHSQFLFQISLFDRYLHSG